MTGFCLNPLSSKCVNHDRQQRHTFLIRTKKNVLISTTLMIAVASTFTWSLTGSFVLRKSLSQFHVWRYLPPYVHFRYDHWSHSQKAIKNMAFASTCVQEQ